MDKPMFQGSVNTFVDDILFARANNKDGISAEKKAEMFGYDDSAIRKWAILRKNGKDVNPKMAVALAAGRAYGIRLSDYD